jgi:hypothetical protein
MQMCEYENMQIKTCINKFEMTPPLGGGGSIKQLIIRIPYGM